MIAKIIQTALGEIYLWEAENYLERIAAGEKKRVIERSEIQKKLDDLGICNEILYTEKGQPYLKDIPEKCISISHCNGVFALYIATQPVGIDIEFKRDSMFEGRNYFVNKQEEQGDLSQETLQLIWGAKEAFYKQRGGEIIDLKNEVTIIEINWTKKTLIICYDSQHFHLKFEKFEELYVVYVVY